ncbi:MAG TPA: PorV/PorQ family protein [bacterium]|nr:PorV/PorQ family protein [bacterium]
MKKIILILLINLMLVNFLASQEQVTKVGTTAAGFLNIDVGSNAIGMGSAFVSVANDATAMYWNASGLAWLQKNEAVFTYNNWIADLTFNYAGIAIPLSVGTIGASATFLTMDEMERTTVNYPYGTGEKFSAGSYAFSLAYARALTDRFAIGANFKYIHEYILNSSATGVAFDIGTIFKTQFHGLNIGMNISNFGTKMRMQGRDLMIQVNIDPLVSGSNENINAELRTESYDLPLMFRVGVSMDVLKGRGNSNLILAVDALHPNDDVEYVNLGGSYVFNRMFSLSAGYKTLFAADSEEGVSFGAGFYYQLFNGLRIRLNYAFQDFGILKDIQQFSMAIEF